MGWVRDNYLQPTLIWEKTLGRYPDGFCNDPDLCYFIACCYYQLKQYENAVQYYVLLLNNWPGHRYAFGAESLILACFEEAANAEK